MALKIASYSEVRDRMQPGDVIAFSGKGNFSEIIKWATRASVSHVGVILQSKLLIDDDPQEGKLNQIIESTTLDGFSGVSIGRVSDRLAQYEGEVWWLPLSEGVRRAMDLKKFYDWLLHQNRKPYDLPQAIKSALDALDDVPLLRHATYNFEDFSRFFCSELVAAALEISGAVPHLNASEVTPIDLCMFSLYAEDYYLIKGQEKKIRGYNTLSPVGWGE